MYKGIEKKFSGISAEDKLRLENARLKEELTRQTMLTAEGEKIEEALRESEEKYRTLFNSIDDGFCTIEVLFDRDGKTSDYRFLEINAVFEELTGIENGVGRRMREIAPGHEEFWYEIYGRIAKTGEPARFEHEAAALGKYYDVYAFRVGKPEENRVAVLFSDISERKRTEKELHEYEERFRLFVITSSEIVYIMSADWSEMRSLRGKGFLADTRAPSLTWFEKYVPDSDSKLVQTKIDEAIRDKTMFELEHRVIRIDGTIGWMYSRAIPFLDKQGEIIEWFGMASDITERKRQEQRQAYLLKLSDALRQLYNPVEIQDTVIREAMDYFEADRCYYCEIEGGDIIVRRDVFRNDLLSVSGKYPINDFTIFKRVIDAGQAFIVQDVHTTDLMDEALKQLCIQFQVISFVNVPVIKEGKAVGIFCLVQSEPRNWTEIEVELAVETAERTWAAVERAKVELAKDKLLKQREEFIAIASHELKTPVTSIRLLAELIEDQFHKEGRADKAAMVTKLNTQVDRLVKLINDLLDTSKIEEGRIVYYTETIALNELIAQRTEEVQRISPKRRIMLDLDEPVNIKGDRERLAQVIVNLLSNAIKYSPDKEEIIVRTRRTENEVTVSVIDRGIGIPEGSIGKIFDRFYRVGGYAMNTYPGIGLGLYISSQIINNHGGRMCVKSEEGEGSEFSFTLPLQ